MNLDKTLPYDKDELQELNTFASGPEEWLQTLFNTEAVTEEVEDSGKEAGTSDSVIDGPSVPSSDVIHDSYFNSLSAKVENSDSVRKELVQGMTKCNRRIMRMRHLWNYVMGEDKHAGQLISVAIFLLTLH